MEKDQTLKLDNQLCFRLYAASRKIIKKYTIILDEYNLTYTQYLTMLVLWEEEKISVKGIGKRLHLDSGTLTPLLKKLEQMELIIKYRDKSDDRVVLVELTEKGKELKKEMIDVPSRVFCSVGLPIDKALSLKEDLDFLLEVLE